MERLAANYNLTAQNVNRVKQLLEVLRKDEQPPISLNVVASPMAQ